VPSYAGTTLTGMGSAHPSVEELREHIAVLTQFEADYRAYLDAQRRGVPELQAELRNRLLRRAGKAQRAVTASGVVFAITPAPALGGRVLTSVAEMIFAHEHPAYGGDSFWPNELPSAARHVMDGLAAVLGVLEESAAESAASSRTTPPRPPTGNQKSRPRLTLFGRIRSLPAALATLADVVAVGGALVGVAKAVGLW